MRDLLAGKTGRAKRRSMTQPRRLAQGLLGPLAQARLRDMRQTVPAMALSLALFDGVAHRAVDYLQQMTSMAVSAFPLFIYSFTYSVSA